MFAARDYIIHVGARDLTAVRDKLLQVPNMNTTGRLPVVLLLHMKMQVRIASQMSDLPHTHQSIQLGS